MACRSAVAGRFFTAFYRWNSTLQVLPRRGHAASSAHRLYLHRPRQSSRVFFSSISKSASEEPDLQHPTAPSVASLEELPARMRELMRYVSHPVAVVTASSWNDANAKRTNHAMTVSSFNTVSLEPCPIISFNVRTPSRTLDAIQNQQGHFRIHVLNSHTDAYIIADAFTRGNAHEGFEKLEKMETSKVVVRYPDTGVIRAPEISGYGVLSILECSMLPDKMVTVEDHVIVVARVVRLLSRQSGWALTYVDRQYRRVRPRYLNPPSGKQGEEKPAPNHRKVERGGNLGEEKPVPTARENKRRGYLGEKDQVRLVQPTLPLEKPVTSATTLPDSRSAEPPGTLACKWDFWSLPFFLSDAEKRRIFIERFQTYVRTSEQDLVQESPWDITTKLPRIQQLFGHRRMEVPPGALGIDVENLVRNLHLEWKYGADWPNHRNTVKFEEAYEFYGRITSGQFPIIVERVKDFFRKHSNAADLPRAQIFKACSIHPASELLCRDLLSRLREAGLARPPPVVDEKASIIFNDENATLELFEIAETRALNYLRKNPRILDAKNLMKDLDPVAVTHKDTKLRISNNNHYLRCYWDTLVMKAFPITFAPERFEFSGEITPEQSRVIIDRFISYVEVSGNRRTDSKISPWRLPTWMTLYELNVHPGVTGIDMTFIKGKLRFAYRSALSSLKREKLIDVINELKEAVAEERRKEFGERIQGVLTPEDVQTVTKRVQDFLRQKERVPELTVEHVLEAVKVDPTSTMICRGRAEPLSSNQFIQGLINRVEAGALPKHRIETPEERRTKLMVELIRESEMGSEEAKAEISASKLAGWNSSQEKRDAMQESSEGQLAAWAIDAEGEKAAEDLFKFMDDDGSDDDRIASPKSSHAEEVAKEEPDTEPALETPGREGPETEQARIPVTVSIEDQAKAVLAKEESARDEPSRDEPAKAESIKESAKEEPAEKEVKKQSAWGSLFRSR